MPTCPGCEKHISYPEIRAHERYCRALWTDGGLGDRAAISLESRLESLETRLRECGEQLEADANGDPVRANHDLASK